MADRGPGKRSRAALEASRAVSLQAGAWCSAKCAATCSHQEVYGYTNKPHSSQHNPSWDQTGTQVSSCSRDVPEPSYTAETSSSRATKLWSQEPLAGSTSTMQISKTPVGRFGRLVRVHPGSKDDPHNSQQHYELVHILSVTGSQRFTWSTLSISIGPDTNSDCAPAPLYDVPAVQPAMLDARSESCTLQCSATELPPRKGAKPSVGNPEPNGTTSQSEYFGRAHCDHLLCKGIH